MSKNLIQPGSEELDAILLKAFRSSRKINSVAATLLFERKRLFLAIDEIQAETEEEFNKMYKATLVCPQCLEKLSVKLDGKEVDLKQELKEKEGFIPYSSDYDLFCPNHNSVFPGYYLIERKD